MTENEFYELVESCRAKQNQYFKYRGGNPEVKSQILTESKELERKVDTAIKNRKSPKLEI